MRCVIFADVHLGKKQFSAQKDGRNLREQDIEKAWHAAVEIIVQAQPDLVLCGGDVFEHPRVSAFAVKAWRDGVRRISTETAAHLVVVSGNHDCARSGDIMSPLTMPDDYERVHIVMKPERINLIVASGERVSIACHPFVARGDGVPYLLDPDPSADVNCVLIHAAARTSAAGVDALPKFYAGPEALDIGREAERFDLIAAGDYHTFTRLHPTALAFYPGSTERTSSNIWAEPEAKGVVIADTDAKTMEFKEVPTRPMRDYGYYDLANRDWTINAERLNDCMKLLANAGPEVDTTQEIVRLKVDDFPLEEREHIDWALVRTLKASMTHFYLDIHYHRSEEQALGDRRERGLTMAEEAVKFFKDDDEHVRLLAMSYMDVQAEAEDVEEGEL